MPGPSTAATMVFTLRIAYGAGLMLTPDSLTKRWLGEGGRQPAAHVALRGLGAREVVLHAGGLLAALRGKPIRPWIAASIAGDIVDILATTASREGLPEKAAPATLAVAGASALLSAAVGVAADS